MDAAPSFIGPQAQPAAKRKRAATRQQQPDIDLQASTPQWPNIWLASAQILSETMLARCAAQYPDMLKAASVLSDMAHAATRKHPGEIQWDDLAYAAMDVADVAQQLGRAGTHAIFWAEALECADLLASAALHRPHCAASLMRAFARAARLSLHRSHCDAALLRNLPGQADAQPDFASTPT